MVQRNAIVTVNDHERLQRLLSSELSDTIIDKSYLQDLKGELERAQIVISGAVPSGIVTMNSTVRLRDIDTGERGFHARISQRCQHCI